MKYQRNIRFFNQIYLSQYLSKLKWEKNKFVAVGNLYREEFKIIFLTCSLGEEIRREGRGVKMLHTYIHTDRQTERHTDPLTKWVVEELSLLTSVGDIKKEICWRKSVMLQIYCANYL